MQIEGNWWFLVEEEPFDADRTKQLTFDAGSVLDGRTDEQRGSYAVDGDDLVVLLSDGSQIVARIQATEPTIISGTLIEGQGEDEMRLPVLLNRTEALVMPLFPQMA